MTAAAKRERLYDYIRIADDEKIKDIYEIFEDQMIPVIDWADDKEFVAELDERLRRYKTGIDRGYSWKELETSIEELKKKRSAK